jgi:chorismate mutase/prephenate dehydratase
MSELDVLRGGIDEVDRQIVTLFERRMAITRQVGEYKQSVGMPVLDPRREREVLEAKTAWLTNPELKTDVVLLYETIMGISRRQQRRLVQEGEDPDYLRILQDIAAARTPVEHPRVVYQGEPGAYSEMAAMNFFGPEVQAKGLKQFRDVFLAIKNKEADYGVLPIENTSTGAIRQIYDLLTEYDCHMVGETTVRVAHCLMALPGTSMEDIRTVYSHEQGLFQCEAFLNAHPDWKQIPQDDTAGSAMMVARSGDPTKAAICSKRSADIYGLEILAEDINSNAENTTRFVVVAPQMELREGRDKICTCFRVPHQSGSLHEILTIFAVHGLNMVRLESRPVQGHNFEYMFFLEFTGDLLSPDMPAVLRELTQSTDGFRVFGNFASGLES